jgi:phospholipid-binding lipoprotein MlaA
MRPAALAVLALALAGCATTGARDPADPLQPVNRGVYQFNDSLDRATLKPVATAYHEHTPSWLQTGVGNFFANLTYPGTALNNLLQGKVVAAGQDTLRFVINTTLGWGGVLDVASGAGLPHHDEDLGQTLGKWGVPAGPYLMVPLLGPSTVRDLPSRIADTLLEPLYWFDPGNARWVSLGVSLVDTRARLLPLDETLDGVYDKYAFVRNAYLQRRQFLVYDGNPPEQPVEQELLDEAGSDDQEAPPPQP